MVISTTNCGSCGAWGAINCGKNAAANSNSLGLLSPTQNPLRQRPHALPCTALSACTVVDTLGAASAAGGVCPPSTHACMPSQIRYKAPHMRSTPNRCGDAASAAPNPAAEATSTSTTALKQPSMVATPRAMPTRATLASTCSMLGPGIAHRKNTMPQNTPQLCQVILQALLYIYKHSEKHSLFYTYPHYNARNGGTQPCYSFWQKVPCLFMCFGALLDL